MSYKTPDPFTGALLQAARNWISQQGGLGAVAKEAPQFAASLLPNLSRSLGASNPISAFVQDYNPKATYANQGQGPVGRAIGGALDAATQAALLVALAGPEGAAASDSAGIASLPPWAQRTLAKTTVAVDDTGAPVRLLHGTATNFDVPKASGAGNAVGPGFYSTEGAFKKTLSWPEYQQKLLASLRDDVAREEANGRFANPDHLAWLQNAIVQVQRGTSIADVPASHYSEALAAMEPSEPVTTGYALARAGDARYMGQQPAAQVRFLYGDFRHPLDLTKPIPASDVARIRATVADVAPGRLGQFDKIFGKGTEPYQGGGHSFYRQLSDIFGGDQRLTNSALEQSGFDGITHWGSNWGLGKTPHRVWVSFHPETQMFSGLRGLAALGQRALDEGNVTPAERSDINGIIKEFLASRNGEKP